MFQEFQSNKKMQGNITLHSQLLCVELLNKEKELKTLTKEKFIQISVYFHVKIERVQAKANAYNFRF